MHVDPVLNFSLGGVLLGPRLLNLVLPHEFPL